MTGASGATGEGKSALIGHSGFVGGTLLRDRHFDDHFNSRNIEEIGGRSYDLVVCAGAPGAKWRANARPAEDRASLSRLRDALANVTARAFILISTVDVYPDPASGADESAAIDPSLNHPYGAHRYALETWVRERFPASNIVRLAALFGEGLRKNPLYDLVTGQSGPARRRDSAMQWYPMRRLAADLDRIREAGLPLVNLVGEPLALGEIIDAFFPGTETGANGGPAPRYDLRTLHAQALGGGGGYILDARSILDEIGTWVADERRRGSP